MDQTTFTENTTQQDIKHKVENEEKQPASVLGDITSSNARDVPYINTKDAPGIDLNGHLLGGSVTEYIPYDVRTNQGNATNAGENSCAGRIHLNVKHDNENLELNLIRVKNDSLPVVYVEQMDTTELQNESSIWEKPNNKKAVAASSDSSQTDVYKSEIVNEDDGAGKNDKATDTEIKEPCSVVDSDVFDDMLDVATSIKDDVHMHCSTVENPAKYCNYDASKGSNDVPKLNAASRNFQSDEWNGKEENNNKHLKEEFVQEHVTKRDGDQNSAGNTEVGIKTNDVKTSAVKTLRLVLIGQTGAGKSSTGNTLLGVNKFTRSSSSKSCTEVSQRESTVKRGLILEVIDTPGLFDTHKPPEELRKEFSNCMMMTNPGPHVFLLILKMNRITEQEKKTLRYLKEIFGGDQFLSYTIIVITRKEDFEETCFKNTEKTNEDIHELFQTTLENSPDLHHMVMQCKNRYFLLSNKGRVDGIKRTEQANQLMSLILEMTQENKNTFYSYQYFIELEEERKQKLKREAEKKEEDELFKREMDQKEELAKIREKELQLELERAEMERESEKERARNEKAQLEAKLRQEQLKRQIKEQGDRERYLAELERERERKERKREKLRQEARWESERRYIEQNQWRCVVM